ncbi:MAG: hypothetical protein JWP35_2983, partial [Caulobacter sp.]|nr:hypothetical protein [Caulobacter sp.]
MMGSMTPPPEPSDDISAPRDPASYGPPRHLFSRGFIIMMVFGLLCILAGAAVTLLVPKLWPAKADPAAAPTSAPATAIGPRGDLGTAPPLAGGPPAAPDVAALQARVQALEAGQARTVDAAAASLAAASLAEASQTSRPFSTELASLERVLPFSADLRDLRPLAETGAPTRASLAAAFDPAAARAA